MALNGKELVLVIGTINSGLAATSEYVTTQQIANLNTLGTGVVGSPLVGTEQIFCLGASGAGPVSSIPISTTTSAIAALGSIGVSTLTGLEVVPLGNSLTGTVVVSGPLRYATTLQIGG